MMMMVMQVIWSRTYLVVTAHFRMSTYDGQPLLHRPNINQCGPNISTSKGKLSTSLVSRPLTA